jgi:hypothetical protein
LLDLATFKPLNSSINVELNEIVFSPKQQEKLKASLLRLKKEEMDSLVNNDEEFEDGDEEKYWMIENNFPKEKRKGDNIVVGELIGKVIEFTCTAEEEED